MEAGTGNRRVVPLIRGQCGQPGNLREFRLGLKIQETLVETAAKPRVRALKFCHVTSAAACACCVYVEST